MGTEGEMLLPLHPLASWGENPRKMMPWQGKKKAEIENKQGRGNKEKKSVG